MVCKLARSITGVNTSVSLQGRVHCVMSLERLRLMHIVGANAAKMAPYRTMGGGGILILFL